MDQSEELAVGGNFEVSITDPRRQADETIEAWRFASGIVLFADRRAQICQQEMAGTLTVFDIARLIPMLAGAVACSGPGVIAWFDGRSRRE